MAVTVEVYLLCIMAGMTLLAYMVAINSRGSTRLSVSYLIATLMLAGTVWGVVQHVNSGLDRQQMEEFRRLEVAKQRAEEQVHTKEQELMESRERMAYAVKLNEIINEGTGQSTTMMNIELRDFSVELDVLISRATVTQRNSTALKSRFEKIQKEARFFAEGKNAISEAIEELNEAARYYWLYFRSEDGAQEEIRERMMRQKARKAFELFKKAGSLVSLQG